MPWFWDSVALEFCECAEFTACAHDKFGTEGIARTICIGFTLQCAKATGATENTASARVALDYIFYNTRGIGTAGFLNCRVCWQFAGDSKVTPAAGTQAHE